MSETESWLGQTLIDGEWLDFARGTERASRCWQAERPTERRVVDWIDKGKVLIPPTVEAEPDPSVKVTLTGVVYAHEIPMTLGALRTLDATAHATSYLVLRAFAGVQLSAPEDRDAQLPLPTQGVLIESARRVEHDGFEIIEVTIWGIGEMETLLLTPSTPVDVYRVEDAR